MTVNPLLKYVMKPAEEDVLHSSAYGKAQNGQGMGVASSETFAQRRAIDSDRRYIDKYGASSIAAGRPAYTPAPTHSSSAARSSSPTHSSSPARSSAPTRSSAPAARPHPIMPKNPGISR